MAIHTVRVAAIGKDGKGDAVVHEVTRTIGVVGLTTVKTARVYRLEGISRTESITLTNALLAEPIDQRSSIDTPLITDAQEVVEVAYKPGVMNPEVASILKCAHDLGLSLKAADVSTEYGFYGKIEKKDVEHIVNQLLLNKTVEQIVTVEPKSLVITGQPGPVQVIPVRTASIDALMALSKETLFLDEQEMRIIQTYFQKLGRDPTDCELEIIAARWSEHCGHKTFKATLTIDGKEKLPLFTRISKTAKKYFGAEVLSAFSDNSGVMQFYDGQAICGKVETHNSPSAIEPYGGAMTGSGGVFRDILGTGQGAKVVISTDMFCFAPPDLDPANLPPGTLSPDYLQRRVVAGVRDYGNRMGIPTNNGSVHYHSDFRAKPSVIVGAYGIMPEKRVPKGKPKVHDVVVVIGGRTGRDGIHGATFSSGEMTHRTVNVNSSAVQIGNAIEEKRMADAIIEARDHNLIRAITDCGAAGLSSAIGEIAEDTGVTVTLEKAPVKYPGLAPWEIWLSESQERMVLAVAPKKIDSFLAICHKYNVEATVLGEFDGSHRLTIKFGKKNVAQLSYDFLKNGLPQRQMVGHWTQSVYVEKRSTVPQNWTKTLKQVLAHGNVASKEPIVRQYDHGVQGTSALPPFTGSQFAGPNDAAVITPILGKPYAMIVAHGMNPILNRIDPYWGSVWAVTEAMANYVAVGGDPDQAAIVNNYIWPFPDEESMGSLDQAVDAVVDCMDALKRPVISGKDSLSSTYRGKDGLVIKIPPTLCVSVFGRLPDAKKTVSSDFKNSGSCVYLVGAPDPKLGGSTYFDIQGLLGNEVPHVHLRVLPKILQAMHRAIKSGHILACHDVSEGGVISTVAEMAFGGECGAKLTLTKNLERPDEFLFNETAGMFIVEVADDSIAKKLFAKVPYLKLGRTTQVKELAVQVGKQPLFSAAIDELQRAWQTPLTRIFQS